MGLQDALKAASEAHQLTEAKLQQDRLLEYHASLYSKASAYDNAVILGGFAAFFALWAGTADDIPRVARLVTVGLIGVSLMAFIAVTLGLMLLRQWHLEWRQADLFSSHPDPSKFNEAYDRVQVDFNRRQAKVLPVAMAAFWLSLGSGFLAGSVLIYNALAVAFGWPVLTG